MLYVFAPTHQQARYWLEEFGTHPRDREVRIVVAPFRKSHEGTADWMLRIHGMRWEDGDELLLVGDPMALDQVDVLRACRYLQVPDDLLDRELAAQ